MASCGQDVPNPAQTLPAAARRIALEGGGVRRHPKGRGCARVSGDFRSSARRLRLMPVYHGSVETAAFICGTSGSSWLCLRAVAAVARRRARRPRRTVPAFQNVTTCAHRAGWQQLANRIGADVYCPGWLPDPLIGQIGGTVEQHQLGQQGPQLPRELHLAGHRHACAQRRAARDPARLPGEDDDPDLPRGAQGLTRRRRASRRPTDR